MVERGRAPSRRRVARLAIVRKCVGAVTRVRGLLKIILVALITGIVRQTVIPVYVTILAHNLSVPPGQRKPGLVVIECGRTPCRGGVARYAVVTEIARHMGRGGRRLEISRVTAEAVGGKLREPVVQMALTAEDGPVGPRQWKCRLLMVETSRP
jgi:hypothetical protein